MKKYIIFALSITFSASVFAENEIVFFKNETLDSCYKRTMSSAVQNCMIYLSENKKKEYEKQFNTLIKNATNEKEEFHNYNEFLNAINSSKKKWDEFVEDECLAEAYLDEKESFAFYTDKNACLVKAYNERIEFYKNYQF
ncbi:DUF1311 domain-containing protein [Rosenbergiella nectarea]|uniref:DUF1311 domain-containing protein n=1 Tax=Rosenbergiella nectarea TaxID=988801 RepID=UPI001F4EF561|nr:DUF1311 domain-containing protein [Rosenbergiella nectarea]